MCPRLLWEEACRPTRSWHQNRSVSPPGSWVPATEASGQAQDGQDTVEDWVSGPGPVVDSHPSQQHAIAHHQQPHYSNATAAEIGYPFASPEWAPLASGQPPTQVDGYVPYPRPPQRSPERAPSAAARGHHRPGAAAHATSWRSGNQQQQQYAQREAAEHEAAAAPPPHPTGPRHGQNAGSFSGRPEVMSVDGLGSGLAARRSSLFTQNRTPCLGYRVRLFPSHSE